MFSESALLHLSICLTGLVLFAKAFAHNRLEKNQKLGLRLRSQRRRLDRMFTRSRSQRVKLARKRMALAKRREMMEKKLEAIQWAGVAQWADFNEAEEDVGVAELAAASA